MNHAEKTVHGLSKGNAADYDVVYTSHGSMKLPKTFPNSLYSPSVDTLDLLTHTSDTRQVPPPDRFYK
jgi:hypothetical protein